MRKISLLATAMLFLFSACKKSSADKKDSAFDGNYKGAQLH